MLVHFRILYRTSRVIHHIKTNATRFYMIPNLRLDLHGELIQLDDLYKERHNNVNDSLLRLHALERNLAT